MLDILHTLLSLAILVAVLALHLSLPLPRAHPLPKRRVFKTRPPKHLRPYDDLRLTNL